MDGKAKVKALHAATKKAQEAAEKRDTEKRRLLARHMELQLDGAIRDRAAKTK